MSADLKRQVLVALALRGKTQSWLANELNMNTGYLSRILNGRDEPAEQIERIKLFLNLKSDDAENENVCS